MYQSDHFAFAVSDIDASIRFYSETLGLRFLSREVDEAHHEAYAFLELGGGNLELVQLLDENNTPVTLEMTEIRPPYCPHLAIETADMDELVSMLKGKDAPIVKGPLEIPGRAKWVYVSDPDNNVIEFIQRL